jgi:hypothetical protein
MGKSYDYITLTFPATAGAADPRAIGIRFP